MAAPVFKLPISDTLKTAWQKIPGSKSTFWFGIITLFFISVAFSVLTKFFKEAPVFYLILKIIQQMVVSLLQAGLIYLGVMRALDLSIKPNMFFRAFEWDIAIKCFILYFLQMLIILPFLILSFGGFIYSLKDLPGYGTDPNFFANASSNQIIAGLQNNPVSIALIIFGFIASLYFGIRMSLALPFIVDKKLKASLALVNSFKATRKNFWRLLIVYLFAPLLFLICFIGLFLITALIKQFALPKVLLIVGFLFFIPFIWLLPFAFLTLGTVYRKLLANVPII